MAMFVKAEPSRFDGSTSQIVQAISGRIATVKEYEAEHLQRLYDAGIRQLDGAESAPPLSDAMRERPEALGDLDPREGQGALLGGGLARSTVVCLLE
ncbi:MAG: hypothetical protein VCB43_05195 [Myxococcota bacterium]